MAQASGLTEVLVVRPEGRDKQRMVHVPVLKWVLAVVVAAVVSTVAGGMWIFQEMLAVHSLTSDDGLLELFVGATNRAGLHTFSGLLAVLGAAWCILAALAVRSVRTWGASLIHSKEEAQEEFSRRLEEAEVKAFRANAAAEFWKGQAREADQKAGAAEAARSELEQRMDRLTAREKTLAKEQDALSRSKERLEKHVEARTIELQRLQQRYVSILNSAGEGICSCDLEGRISFANPAAASMMGWTSEELIGQVEGIVFANHASKPGSEAEDSPKEASHRSPVVFQRKDGSKFPVEVVRTPVQEAGRNIGTVLIFKDVTERTEADERFATKVAELARSNSELEQFAFVASHDLQEPLRKIQAFGDRLRARLGDQLASEASDYLARMQSAAARMQGLIDGLLMYSRVLTRAQPFTRVDLTTVAKEVIEDLEVRIEKAGAEVRIGHLPTIEADALQIRQLLQNLIGNALKFQRPGNPPRVTVSARILARGETLGPVAGNTELVSRGEMCELTVADNGIGFDEAYLKRLFVVFQRLHSRSEFEGAGIGLAVCRKIANRHGGSITARSKPGQGATFCVLLPVQQPAGQGVEP